MKATSDKRKEEKWVCGFMWHPEGVEKWVTAYVRMWQVSGLQRTDKKRRKRDCRNKIKIRPCDLFKSLSNKTEKHRDTCFPFSAFFRVFLECIEFIEWTDEIGPYRYDNYLCFSWQVDSRAPSSFHVLSVRNDCDELRLC